LLEDSQLNRAGFSWWEAWGPVAYLGFQKGGAIPPIELRGFKNWGVWCETPCWWEA